MTDTTPAPAEPGAPDNQALSDAQWEAALKDKPLPNTPPAMLQMAQATRQALEQAAAVEEPSAQDIDRAWQRVLNKAQAQGLTSPSASPSLWQRLLAAWRLPRMAATVPDVCSRAMRPGISCGPRSIALGWRIARRHGGPTTA